MTLRSFSSPRFAILSPRACAIQPMVITGVDGADVIVSATLTRTWLLILGTLAPSDRA